MSTPTEFSSLTKKVFRQKSQKGKRFFTKKGQIIKTVDSNGIFNVDKESFLAKKLKRKKFQQKRANDQNCQLRRILNIDKESLSTTKIKRKKCFSTKQGQICNAKKTNIGLI